LETNSWTKFCLVQPVLNYLRSSPGTPALTTSAVAIAGPGIGTRPSVGSPTRALTAGWTTIATAVFNRHRFDTLIRLIACYDYLFDITLQQTLDVRQ